MKYLWYQIFWHKDLIQRKNIISWYIVGDIVIQILVISPTLSYYYQSRSEQASITWSLICRLCLVEQVTLWEEALDYRHVTAAEVEVAGWKMTLLAGDGSDYDYSALSCTSDTSLNVPPIQEQEALKGVYYKRAQRLPPTDPSIPNALHPDDNGNYRPVASGCTSSLTWAACGTSFPGPRWRTSPSRVWASCVCAAASMRSWGCVTTTTWSTTSSSSTAAPVLSGPSSPSCAPGSCALCARCAPCPSKKSCSTGASRRRAWNGAAGDASCSAWRSTTS